MLKRIITLLAVGLIMSPLMVSANDEVEGGLPLIRTTVYYAKPGAKTATGKEARYGIVAFDPAYYGKTCILYTEDHEYIGIFECEDTGGHLIRTGQRLDVYTGTTLESCYDWAEQNGTYCYVQWIESEG
jgi:hypothetical protein